jgi:hypothetical protein
MLFIHRLQKLTRSACSFSSTSMVPSAWTWTATRYAWSSGRRRAPAGRRAHEDHVRVRKQVPVLLVVLRDRVEEAKPGAVQALDVDGHVDGTAIDLVRVANVEVGGELVEDGGGGVGKDLQRERDAEKYGPAG